MKINTNLKGDQLKDLVTHTDMSELLKDNHLLELYIREPLVVINSFLMGFSPSKRRGNTQLYDPDDEAGFTTPGLREFYNETKAGHLGRIFSGKIPVSYLFFAPVTKDYVRYLIQLDEMMRLSKYYHKTPQKVYRGTIDLKDVDMTKLNSWTPSGEISARFRGKSGLEATLPSGFPFIEVDKTHVDSFFKGEKELVLPPCDFETKAHTHVQTDKNDYYDIEVVLRPRSLAKVFLERMKNPPEGYPKAFLTDPVYGYQKAMEMLEYYVTEFVDKKKIRVNDELIDELPDPEVVFEGDKTTGD